MRKDSAGTTDLDVGVQIRKAATERGITLRQLGDLMGVSRPTIYAYASGTLRVPNKRLPDLARILGKSESYFRPKSAEDLDPSTDARRALDLIEALLSPTNPTKALEVALQAATNAPEAKQPTIRAEFLRRAGNARALVGDHLGALRNLDDARTAFEAAGQTESAARCSQTLGLCCTALGRLADAQECFESSSRDLPEAERWKGRSSLASLAERRGEFRAAEAMLSELLGDPTLGNVPMAYIRANFASMTCAAGFWHSGLSQCETALSAATEANLPDQMVEMMIAVARCHTHIGRYDDAWTMHVRAHDVATGIADVARATYNQVAKAQLEVRLGEAKAGKESALEAMQTAVQNQFVRSESLALLVLTEASLETGQFEEAEIHAVQAIGHGQRHSYPVAVVYGETHRALAVASLGRASEAVRALDAVEDSTAGLGEPRARFFAARAFCHAVEGNARAQESDQAMAADCAEACGVRIELPTALARVLASV